jgi:hypothetical protein
MGTRLLAMKLFLIHQAQTTEAIGALILSVMIWKHTLPLKRLEEPAILSTYLLGSTQPDHLLMLFLLILGQLTIRFIGAVTIRLIILGLR